MDIALLQTRVSVPRLICAEHSRQSSIDRRPVTAAEILLNPLGLAGDQPYDVRPHKTGQMHGGPDKAVYVYPFKHYNFWRALLGPALTAGRGFGENLLVQGVTEADVRIGDQWRWGHSLLEVSDTIRKPCVTLNCYYAHADMIDHMFTYGRNGWYMRVLSEPQHVPTSGTLTVVRRGAGPSIAEAFAAKAPKK